MRKGLFLALLVAVTNCSDNGALSHGLRLDGGNDATSVEPLDAADATPLTLPATLGASYDGPQTIIRFRVFSEHATRLELDVYAAATGEDERAHYVMTPDPVTSIWSVDVPVSALASAGIGAVVYYGYRAWGPNFTYDPTWTHGSLAGFVSEIDGNGNRFDPNKLLFDPYGRELSHDPETPAHPDGNSYTTGDTRATDTGQFAPKSIVIAATHFDIGTKPARLSKTT